MSRVSDCVEKATRRDVIRSTWVLVGAPIFARVIEDLTSTMAMAARIKPAIPGAPSELDMRLVRLLSQAELRGNSYFTAEAQDPLTTIVLLFELAAAVVTILTYFGIRPRFESRVSYADSSARQPCFQQAEITARQNGYQSFSGVSRAPLEQHFSVLVAKDEEQRRAELVTAYEGRDSVQLTGWEPSIFHAAMKHIKDRYPRLSENELAHAMALTGKVQCITEGKYYSRLSTAGGGILLHDPTPRPDCPLGSLAIHLPGITSLDSAPVLWLRYKS